MTNDIPALFEALYEALRRERDRVQAAAREVYEVALVSDDHERRRRTLRDYGRLAQQAECLTWQVRDVWQLKETYKLSQVWDASLAKWITLLRSEQDAAE